MFHSFGCADPPSQFWCSNVCQPFLSFFCVFRLVSLFAVLTLLAHFLMFSLQLVCQTFLSLFLNVLTCFGGVPTFLQIFGVPTLLVCQPFNFGVSTIPFNLFGVLTHVGRAKAPSYFWCCHSEWSAVPVSP